MTDWSNRTNATLLDIDQWFGVHGDIIPEVPRAELERHLRRLSEQIHGYHGFLGAQTSLRIFDEVTPMNAKWFDAEPPVPVHTFGAEADQEKLDEIDADRVTNSVLWSILLIGILAFIAGIAGLRADETHMDKYHADPQYDAWFRSLRGPVSAAHPGGIDCCNLNDCDRVDAEWKQRPDGSWGWRAQLPQRGMQWFDVPEDRIVKDKPSIDGEAYACVSTSNLAGSPIRCFVPAIPGG